MGQEGWGDQRSPSRIAVLAAQFCVSAPVQHAIANVLQRAEQPYLGHPNYYDWLRCMLRSKRALLEASVRRAGMIPMAGQGGASQRALTHS